MTEVEKPEGGLLYRLEYDLVTDSWELDFANPPRLQWTDPDGHLELELDERGHLVVEMLSRHERDADARRAAEPVLRSWEIQTLLDHPGAQFSFEFAGARVSDRETSTWRPSSGVRVTQVGLEVMIGKPPPQREYPPVPTDFKADELVLRMWRRWLRYRSGAESLETAGNYCLTELTGAAGDLPSAAVDYAISRPVLRKLSELCALKGGEETARKAGAMPMTREERTWIDAAVQLLIRRAGMRAAGVSQPQATMADLPPLP